MMFAYRNDIGVINVMRRQIALWKRFERKREAERHFLISRSFWSALVPASLFGIATIPSSV
jgi:hypothetical protein